MVRPTVHPLPITLSDTTSASSCLTTELRSSGMQCLFLLEALRFQAEEGLAPCLSDPEGLQPQLTEPYHARLDARGPCQMGCASIQLHIPPDHADWRPKPLHTVCRDWGSSWGLMARAHVLPGHTGRLTPETRGSCPPHSWPLGLESLPATCLPPTRGGPLRATWLNRCPQDLQR